MSLLLKPKHTAIIVLPIILLCAYYLYVIYASQLPLKDFAGYYRAAEKLRAGENIYLIPEDGTVPYLYPPFLAFILSYFLNLDRSTLHFIWCLLTYLSTLGAGLALTLLPKALHGRQKSFAVTFTLSLFLLFAFEPFGSVVAEGQVNGIIFLLLALFLLCELKERSTLAGIMLALATLIKVTPAILLLPAICFKRIRLLGAFAGTVAICSLLMFIILPNTFTMLKSYVVTAVPEHLSKDFFGSPFNFAPAYLIVEYISALESYARPLLALFFGALTVFVLCHFKQSTPVSRLKSYSIFISLMVVISPVIWVHHLFWLCIPLWTAAVIADSEPRNTRLKYWTIYLSIYFILSRALFLHYYALKQIPEYSWLTAGIPALCTALIIYILCRQKGDVTFFVT